MRWLEVLLVAMAGLVPLASPWAQAPIPGLVDGLNDPGRILSPQQTTDLDARLAGLARQRNCRIAVFIVGDIGRANLIDYAEKAFAAWPAAAASGRQSVLLVVVADRERAWIETHHKDLELATAQRIVFETMVPRFNAGHDIAGGIAAGLERLDSVLGGTPLPAPPEPKGALNSLSERLDGFRYGLQNTSRFAYLLEMFYLAIGVALGFGIRSFAGRWPAALLAAAVAGLGSWLQYGSIVPYAAGAFVIVFFGWKHWLAKGGSPSGS